MSRDRELIERALRVRDNAYAPYSRYPVGCSVLADGGLYDGANVENASYGLSICAERSAIATAIAAGARGLDTVVIATGSSPPATPCGTCRQIMMEFAHEPDRVRVILVNPKGETREHTVAELLPHAFAREQLPENT